MLLDFYPGIGQASNGILLYMSNQTLWLPFSLSLYIWSEIEINSFGNGMFFSHNKNLLASLSDHFFVCKIIPQVSRSCGLRVGNKKSLYADRRLYLS